MTDADEIAAVRARLAVVEAAALCLLRVADLPVLSTASAQFMRVSEEATRALLFSKHPDAAHLAAKLERDRWVGEFLEAVAARAGS